MWGAMEILVVSLGTVEILRGVSMGGYGDIGGKYEGYGCGDIE